MTVQQVYLYPAVVCCHMPRTLGATDPFFDAAATTIHYPFHDIDESAYEQAFEAQLLSNTSRGKAVAETLQASSKHNGSLPLNGSGPSPGDDVTSWRSQPIDKGASLLLPDLLCCTQTTTITSSENNSA